MILAWRDVLFIVRTIYAKVRLMLLPPAAVPCTFLSLLPLLPLPLPLLPAAALAVVAVAAPAAPLLLMLMPLPLLLLPVAGYSYPCCPHCCCLPLTAVYFAAPAENSSLNYQKHAYKTEITSYRKAVLTCCP